VHPGRQIGGRGDHARCYENANAMGHRCAGDRRDDRRLSVLAGLFHSGSEPALLGGTEPWVCLVLHKGDNAQQAQKYQSHSNLVKLFIPVCRKEYS
jgi:hypothetical protein